jgi:uncharacterized protein Usg
MSDSTNVVLSDDQKSSIQYWLKIHNLCQKFYWLDDDLSPAYPKLYEEIKAEYEQSVLDGKIKP